ncbi:hypothetical protein BaRGS_00018792 [Batillaria attramentaria]|uniref:Uncharacterized protein n=1 Tax=Batillaria attramentaria TaxID=370345 RepID=A0ABD0KT28_9CAEN
MPSVCVVKVRLSLYENGVEKAYAEFDGKGSTFTSWFTKDRLLESSWADLKTSPHRFFSIAGHESGGLVRRFFLEKNYGGCPNDNGWLVVLEKNDTCSWGKTDSVPKILYANSQSNVNWDKGQVGVADVMTISVKLLQPAVCPFGK